MQESDIDIIAGAQKHLEQKRGKPKRHGMNGSAQGLIESMDELEKTQSELGLPNANETEFYICDSCGNKVERHFFEFFKTGSRYVFPVCPCRNVEREGAIERQNRLKRRREMEMAFRQNIMNENLQHARFSTFQPRPGTESMYSETRKFADEFDSRSHGLFGYGNPGNGKSHLFVSIHHQLDAEEYICLFLEVPRLFNIVEDAKKFSSKINVNDIINAAIQCDLLTLDELGAGRLTQEEFTDVLFPIINGRQGKKTNYTTNLDLDELREWLAVDKFGRPLDNKGRLIDRILGSCDIIENKASSKRIEDAIRRQEKSNSESPEELQQMRMSICESNNRTEFKV